MRKFQIVTPLIVSVAVACAVAPASAGDQTYFLPSLSQNGVAMDGPAVISLRCVNPLRFANAKLSTDTTTDQPTDVSAAFSGLAAAAAPAAGAAKASAKTLESAFTLDVANPYQLTTPKSDADLVTIRKNFKNLQNEITDKQVVLRDAASGLADLIVGSRQFFPANQKTCDANGLQKAITDVLIRLKGDDVVRFIQAPSNAAAPTPAELSRLVFDTSMVDWPAKDVATVHGELVAAAAAFKQGGPTHKDELAAVDYLLAQLAPDDDGGSAQQAFAKLEATIRSFVPSLTGNVTVGSDDALALSSPEIKCSNALAAQHTTVSFVAEDRLDPTQTKAVTQSIVTVNCYSRLALTTGGAYARIPSLEYTVASAPGTTAGTTVNTVQMTANRPDMTLAIPAMAHFQLSAPGADYAVHLSVAAPVNGSGMVGATLSVKRALWLTLGLFRVETSRLTNGFTVGQTVPSGTTISTTKVPMYRLGGAITFPIVPQASGGKQATPDTSKDNPPKKNPSGPAATPPQSGSTPPKPGS